MVVSSTTDAGGVKTVSSAAFACERGGGCEDCIGYDAGREYDSQPAQHLPQARAFCCATMRCYGFTLIEMSIALVIIGLLIGSILVWTELFHSAKLRKVASEFQSYETAYNTFELKYNCGPGDCRNATSLFGTTDVNGNSVSNGNGNGKVELWAGFENLPLWQHLGLAQLMLGIYTGSYPNPVNLVAGTQVPHTGYDTKSFFWIEDIMASDPYFSDYRSGNYLSIGYGQVGGYGPHAFLCMQARDDAVIDAKLDDGSPITGKIRALIFANCYGVANTYYQNTNNCPIYYYLGN